MAIASISNAEAGSSVRTKLNTVIDFANVNGQTQTPAEVAAGATIVDGNRRSGDIRRYGAIADGSFNCSTAISAAVAQACQPSSAGSQPVYIPPASQGWKCNTAIVVPVGFPFRIYGDVAYFSFLYTDQDITLLTFSDVQQHQGVILERVGLLRTVLAGSTKPGVVFANSAHCIMRECQVEKFDIGIRYSPGVNAPFSSFNCSLVDTSVIGCNTQISATGANVLKFRGVTLGTAPFGLRIADCVNFSWYGGNVEGCTTCNIDIDSIVEGRAGHIIAGLDIEASAASAGAIRIGNTALLRNITIANNCFVNAGAAAYLINPVRCDQLTVSTNSADTGTASGFHINPNGPEQSNFHIFNNTWQTGGHAQIIKGTLAFYDTNVALAGGVGWTGRHADALVIIPYTASMTPNAALGNWHVIVITNASPFTVNNPINPIVGQELLLWFSSSAGAPHGTITWGSAFKMSGPLVVADTGNRHIAFRYNGTAWYESFRSAADVVN